MERGLGSSDSHLKVIWVRVRARRLVSVADDSEWAQNEAPQRTRNTCRGIVCASLDQLVADDDP